MSKPLLSIVIPNFNYGRFLSEAMESLFRQECLDRCEVIIVDAGSSDNTLSVIEYFSGREIKIIEEGGSKWHVCENLIWLSERDKGQSDAFNKGFNFSSGQYLTWLNADEMYAPGAIKSIVRYIEHHPNANWITANDFSFWDDSRKVASVCWGPHLQPAYFTKDRVPSVVFGPSAIFSRNLFYDVGGFDVRLKYGMDTDLWSRILRAGYHQSRLNRFVWAFRWHSESKTFGKKTSKVLIEKAKESDYIKTKGIKVFKKSFLNVHYLIWLCWRVLDLSLIVKYIHKKRLIGCDISKIMGG